MAAVRSAVFGPSGDAATFVVEGTFDCDRPDTTIVALDEKSGRLRWQTELPGHVCNDAPNFVVSGGAVLVATFNQDGTASAPVTPPAVSGGGPASPLPTPGREVLVGLDLMTGRTRWTVPLGDESLYAAGDVVLLLAQKSDSGPRVRAVEVASGRVRWVATVDNQAVVGTAADGVAVIVGPAPGPAPEPTPGTGPVGVPLVATGLDLATGARRWRTALGRSDGLRPLTSSEVVAVPYKYTELNGNGPSVDHASLDALDPATGTKLWTRAASGPEALLAAAAGPGTLYVAQAGGPQVVVEAVAPKSGARLWRQTLPIPGAEVRGAEVIAGPGVVTVADGSEIFGLDPTTGNTMWRQPTQAGVTATTNAVFSIEATKPLHQPAGD
jgi:outer membrane protein assembly factor BamB